MNVMWSYGPGARARGWAAGRRRASFLLCNLDAHRSLHLRVQLHLRPARAADSASAFGSREGRKEDEMLF
jgi:hypothetical protein